MKQEKTLEDFIEGIVFSFEGRLFRVIAEERTNRKDLKKAVLSENVATYPKVEWSKIDSWKPGHDKSKRFGYYHISSEIYETFEACKNAIEKQERSIGVADYV